MLRWETAVHRPYLYAGKGMGPDFAAWKQAARATLAPAVEGTVSYAIVLLDLVKAFERVPHHILAREAKPSLPALAIEVVAGSLQAPQSAPHWAGVFVHLGCLPWPDGGVRLRDN